MATAALSSTSTPSPPHPHITITPTSSNRESWQKHEKVAEEDETEDNYSGVDEPYNEAGHANFKLGVEDSPELLNELRFSLAHSRHASGKNSSRRQSSSKSRSSTNPRIQLTDEEDDDLG